MIHTYNINGMHCGSCAAKVKSALLALPDVLNAEVSQNPSEATITMQKHIATDVLNNAVAKAGAYVLTEKDGHHQVMNTASDTEEEKKGLAVYKPIFLIAAYITGTVLLVELTYGEFDWMRAMRHFMAGFFLIFSFFKMLDLKGFATSYFSYDIVARAFFGYGFIYPFIELALGVAYLVDFNPFLTNLVTLIVMGVSTLGVVKALMRKSQFQCACLGAVFNLPMSKVTLIEDLLMVGMAAVMLIQMF